VDACAATPTAATDAAVDSGARLGRPTTTLGKALKWSYVRSAGGNAIQSVLALAVAVHGRAVAVVLVSRWVRAVWRRPMPAVRTAIARALREPTSTTSFLARVTAV